MTAMIGQRAMSPAPSDLTTIHKDLARLAEAIQSLALERATQVAHEPDPPQDYDDVMLALLARKILKENAARDSILSLEVFSDPTWHILLDLFASEAEGKQVSVSSACIGSGAPSTTALRYLKMLEGRAVIERVPDAYDARRLHVHLTPPYKQRMRDHLRMLADSRKNFTVKIAALSAND